MEALKFFGPLVIVFVGIFLGIAFLSQKTYDSSCTLWGEETGREVKFISNYPWYSDCLTKSGTGAWISTSRIIE